MEGPKGIVGKKLGGTIAQMKAQANAAAAANQTKLNPVPEEPTVDSDKMLLMEEHFPEIASFSQKVEFFAFENHLRKIIHLLIDPLTKK